MSSKITDFLEEYGHRYPDDTRDEAAAIIGLYLRTRGNEIDDIFSAFKELQPNPENLDKLYILVDFIRWEAQSYIQSRKLRPHATSFGMGGDAQPTINISTISSIVAAHYLEQNPVFRDYFECIIKVGTRAVTGDIGSSDIVESLRGFYPQGSGYISLVEMGFDKGYSGPVLEARRRAPEYGMMDICKILFPVSNLSGATVASTGCSDHRYELYLRSIVDYLGHVSVIASSASGHDEIMPGISKFMLKKSGQPWIIETVEIETDDITRRFLRARSNIDEQEQASVDILTGKAPDNVLRVIAANAALFFLPTFEAGDLKRDFESLTENITQFLISQRTKQTIVHPEKGLEPA